MPFDCEKRCFCQDRLRTNIRAKLRKYELVCFGRDAHATGAKYVIITAMQATQYMLAPNAAYDRYTGYKPGCAKIHGWAFSCLMDNQIDRGCPDSVLANRHLISFIPDL
jgi:hypothetical protein